MVVSPWAEQNFVDHTVTDQTSIIHFIEDNWLSGQRLGSGSFDGIANSITQMFNFQHQGEWNVDVEPHHRRKQNNLRFRIEASKFYRNRARAHTRPPGFS